MTKAALVWVLPVISFSFLLSP